MAVYFFYEDSVIFEAILSLIGFKLQGHWASKNIAFPPHSLGNDVHLLLRRAWIEVLLCTLLNIPDLAYAHIRTLVGATRIRSMRTWPDFNKATHPKFILWPSRFRVDLLTNDSKPTDKWEQTDWMAEKNLDGKSNIYFLLLRKRILWSNVPWHPAGK